MLRRPPTRRDEGFTLVEALVSFFMLTLLAIAVGALLANSQKVRAATQNADRAAAQIAKVLQSAQQVNFSELGYYTSDLQGRTGDAQLPLWETVSGAVTDDPATCTGHPCPQFLVEPQVIIGANRPAGGQPFHPPTLVAHASGVDYRIDTWVTDPGDGTRRLTVQAEWPAGDGSCQGTSCLVQTVKRAPVTYEAAPHGGLVPGECQSPTLVICHTFVQSGRVLIGGSFVGQDTHPRQAGPVLLSVRTSHPVTEVTAQWTWQAPGARTVEVTNFQQHNNDPTQWYAIVPPDSDEVGVGQVKGDVRAGETTVQFTATDGTTTAVAQGDAHWTYTQDYPVTVEIVGSPGTCSTTGEGTQTRVRVTGLTFGFGDAFGAEGAKDTVEVTYTLTPASHTGGPTSVTVPAVLDPASLDPHYATDGARVLGGYVNAEFTARAPRAAQCPRTPATGVITVTRASDGVPLAFARTVLAGE